MPCIWLGHIGEYRLRPSRLGVNTTPRTPEAVGRTGEGGIAPISKDEDGIPQYVRARLTVLTLLLKKLEPWKSI